MGKKYVSSPDWSGAAAMTPVHHQWANPYVTHQNQTSDCQKNVIGISGQIGRCSPYGTAAATAESHIPTPGM